MTMGGMKHGKFPWRNFFWFVMFWPTVAMIVALSTAIHFNWIQ